MPRKKKTKDFTKNQALRDILPLYKSANELASKMGLSKQSISIVKNDHQPIFDSIILFIKRNHPEIALEYWEDEMRTNKVAQVKEPNSQYKLNTKKMERFEQELSYLLKNLSKLEDKVEGLQNEVNELRSISNQSQEAS